MHVYIYRGGGLTHRVYRAACKNRYASIFSRPTLGIRPKSFKERRTLDVSSTTSCRLLITQFLFTQFRLLSFFFFFSIHIFICNVSSTSASSLTFANGKKLFPYMMQIVCYFLSMPTLRTRFLNDVQG